MTSYTDPKKKKKKNREKPIIDCERAKFLYFRTCDSSHCFVGKYPIFCRFNNNRKLRATRNVCINFLRLKHTILLNILFSASYTDQKTKNSSIIASEQSERAEIFVMTRRKHAILLIVMLVNSIFLSVQ